MVAGHAGPDAAELLGTYWAHGNPEVMRGRCAEARLRGASLHEHLRPAYFPNIETFVLTEVNATPLRDRLLQADLDRILADSQQVLEQFIQDGRLVIPLAGYVLAATPT
ncbi:MAG: ubiquinone/menaquinone biosynthesis methyltransferase UbiE [Nocardioidaceae bacterium]|nr:ubiquinone/menaquinone biosynthesis methyltransferase UbiE [Nocardioidaceae bacterium]